MKPATFNLANINVKVTISPDARRWVNEYIVSLETYAWEQALAFKAGKNPDHGVTCAFIKLPAPAFATPEDAMSKADRASATAKKALKELEAAPVAPPPAAGKDEFEPVGTMPVVGDRVVDTDDHEVFEVLSLNAHGSAQCRSVTTSYSGILVGTNYFKREGAGCCRILKRAPAPSPLAARIDAAGEFHGVRVFQQTNCATHYIAIYLPESTKEPDFIQRKVGVWEVPVGSYHWLKDYDPSRGVYTELQGDSRLTIIRDLIAKVPAAKAALAGKDAQ